MKTKESNIGDIEFGKCEICGNERQLQRTMYYYGIKCECHSPEHFEMVRHCKDCEPSEPRTTQITLTRKQLEEYHKQKLVEVMPEDVKEAIRFLCNNMFEEDYIMFNIEESEDGSNDYLVYRGKWRKNQKKVLLWLKSLLTEGE